MKIKMFEVEKKFKIPANFTRVLLEQGWKYSKEIHFKDTYFDTESYGLTRNNYWFRKRDTKWQLKCPTQDERQADSVKIDRYQEIEEEKAIFDRLALVLKAESGTIVGETTSNVEIFGLKPIAQFESFRSKYQLGTFTIDLDKTNFGYELGEIEVMCEEKSEMVAATAQIFDMASKLGKLGGGGVN